MLDYNNEIWKDIPHYEGLYQVSSLGRIWSVRSQRYLSLNHDRGGYLICGLTDKYGKRKTEKIHRLVALAFIGEPPEGKTCVNHLNEIKDDNRVENLEWASVKENNSYGTRIERVRQTRNINAKQYKKVLCVETGEVYNSIRDAERKTGLYRSRIGLCCNNAYGANTTGGYHWRFINDSTT